MGGTASRPEPPAHRSLNCRVPTTVEMVNCTKYTVQTTWIDYSGQQRRYYELAPGGSVRQPTFTAHPWCFLTPDAPPGTLLVVDDQSVWYAPPPIEPAAAAEGDAAVPVPVPRACIREASSVPWCPAHHLQFPPAFRAQAAALLCCHRRQTVLQHATSASFDSGPQQHPLLPPTPTPLGWLHRLRQPLSPRRSAPRQPMLQQHAAARAKDQACNLGNLPKELLMEVLVAAAPTIPLVVLPQLPHGVEPGEVSLEAQQHLFRCSSNGGGVGGNGGAAEGQQ